MHKFWVKCCKPKEWEQFRQGLRANEVIEYLWGLKKKYPQYADMQLDSDGSLWGFRKLSESEVQLVKKINRIRTPESYEGYIEIMQGVFGMTLPIMELYPYQDDSGCKYVLGGSASKLERMKETEYHTQLLGMELDYGYLEEMVLSKIFGELSCGGCTTSFYGSTVYSTKIQAKRVHKLWASWQEFKGKG